MTFKCLWLNLGYVSPRMWTVLVWLNFGYVSPKGYLLCVIDKHVKCVTCLLDWHYEWMTNDMPTWYIDCDWNNTVVHECMQIKKFDGWTDKYFEIFIMSSWADACIKVGGFPMLLLIWAHYSWLRTMMSIWADAYNLGGCLQSGRIPIGWIGRDHNLCF